MIEFLRRIIWTLVYTVPQLRPVYETRFTQTPISFSQHIRYLVSLRRFPYWPMHASSIAVDAERIHIGIETSPGLMPGCYIQGSNGVLIGDYTQIAAGVKIISANHSLSDNRAHKLSSAIVIGDYCWLGANSIILPGVKLGTYTIVGAGAVVTKSFADGYCVIAGNPAKIIRQLDPAECVHHRSQYRYHGFISADHFESFRDKYLVRIADE